MKDKNKYQTKSVILLLIFLISLTSITIIISENNSNIIKTKDDKTALKTSDPSTYVIITTNAIESNSDNLSDFVIYKESLGFSVEVITEDEFGIDPGQTRVLNIRNWLISNYISKNIEYVLLIGDPDPDDYDVADTYGGVPMLMCYPRRGAGSDEESPTDYIYADLSGDWDTDSDGYYGEYGTSSQDYNVDFEAEVCVGRIPVYSADYISLDNILKRIINHHDNAGSEKNKILLPMAISNYEDEDYSPMYRTDGLDCPEYVWNNIASPNGMSDTVLYERAGLNPVPTGAFHYDMALTKNNFITQFNNGQGAVLWWAHGSDAAAYRKYWSFDDGDGVPESGEMTWDPFIESTDMGSLENDQPAFFYQSSCENGMPENSDNLGYALLKRGAAISTVSASRVSWYLVGDWAPYRNYADNTVIGYLYMYYLLVDKMTSGKALSAAIDFFWNNWGGQSWMNKMDFNLYGDPSIYYWWESPPPPPPSDSSSSSDGDSGSSSGENYDALIIFIVISALVAVGVATTIIIITKKKGKLKERDVVPPPSYPPSNQPPENPPNQDITYQTTVNLFCTNCGEEFQPNSSFCTKCGSKRLN